MIGAVSGAGSYYNIYYTRGLYGAAQGQSAQQAQQAGRVWTSRQSVPPEVPVQPVRPVTAVDPRASEPVSLNLLIRQGADPAEMAVRMRIQYLEDPASAERAPGAEEEPAMGAEGVQKAFEDGQCQTCAKRKYQDGSDDMGVSYQTPTRIAPEQAASAVRGHENEHVVREQAKARREDRKVVSQSVTLHTDICPECGKVYVSGGTTRTVTAAEQDNDAARQEQDQAQKRTPFSVVA